MDRTQLPEAKFKIFTGLLKAYESEEDGTPRLAGIASSTTRDHHGDVMEETALRDMEAAANGNMTIFLNHSYNVPEDVAGSVERAVVVQRGYDGDNNPNWDLDMDIRINRDNDRAVKSWNAIKNGTKLGLSIGAMIPEGGATRNKETGALTISRVTLLETSIVSIPANPRSWISNAVKALKAAEAETELVTMDVTPSVANVANIAEVGVDETKADVCAGCGGSKRKPKNGCDAEFHESVDDDLEAGIEPVEEKTASQEAETSDPGTEDGAAPNAITEKYVIDDSVFDSAAPESPIDPSMKEGVDGVLKLLESTTAKLLAMSGDLDEAKRNRDEAEKQRDLAVAAANEMFSQARQIFDRLADTPVGRKTSFRAEQNNFDSLEAIYSDEFRQLLKHGG